MMMIETPLSRSMRSMFLNSERQRTMAAAILLTASASMAAHAQDAAVQDPAAVAAQDAGAAKASPQEIVVTATRQATVLRKVPISVAALSQATLDETGARNIDDIASLVPGVTVSTAAGGTGSTQNISIRGISSTVGAATTGIYIDDIPIQTRALSNGTTNTYPMLFDLERVEVLRGPQGTLFGAGAEGGVVRFITTQPDLTTFSGKIRTGLAWTEKGAPSDEAAIAMGGPIVKDTAGFNISGIYRHDGGFIDRIDRFTGVEHNNENLNNSYSLRGALTVKPSKTLTITAALMTQNTHAPGSPVYFESVSDPSKGTFVNQFPTEQLRDDRFTLPTLTVSADLGFADLISTASYLDRQARIRADTTFFIPTVVFNDPLAYGQGEYSYSTIRDSQANSTAEFRLQSKPGSRLGWTMGTFFESARQHGSQINYDPDFSALAFRLTGATVEQLFGVPLVDGTELFHTDIHSTDRQAAAFGEANYEVVDGLKLIAGARVARTTFELSRASSGPVEGGDDTFHATQRETPVTPRFGVSYQATSQTMVYSTVAKGFRVGGANSPVLSLCQAAIAASGLTVGETYKSDSVWSSEVGVKTRTQDGKMAISVSAFNIDWSNIQNRIDLAACGSGFTANLGKANSRGFDIAAEVRPINGLLLNISFGYVDAKLTETIKSGANVLGVNGDKIGGSPWALSASARYEFPVGDASLAYVRTDYQYSSRVPQPDLSVAGTDPEAVGNDALHLLTIGSGLEVGDYEFSIYVNNLLNEHPTLGRSRDSASSPLFYATTIRPRTYGLTASLHF